jgi:site-specific recombinase XerD
MTRVKRHRLTLEQWPSEDRTRWQQAIAVGDVFDEGGRAAHLSDKTRHGLCYGYGCFLGFLAKHHPRLLQRPVPDRVTRDIVGQYAEMLRQTCLERTVAGELATLRQMLRMLYGETDWSWLLAVIRRMTVRARRIPRIRPNITSDRLYQLGTDLMDRALLGAAGPDGPSRQHALNYRDGVLIALLALIPLRRRTVTALEIGRQLIRSGGGWSLEIPPEDTKTRQPLDYAFSLEVSSRMDEYLARFRCQISGAQTHNGVWASNESRPMDDGAIYDMVRRRTKSEFGFPVSLHDFRRAAATLWAIQDPANVRGVKDLLGHSGLGNTSEVHYIKAQSRLAGRTLAKAIENRFSSGQNLR